MENNIINWDLHISYWLFIILLVLKITNTVDWSWWIITLPIWLHFGLMTIGLIIFILFLIFYYIFKNINGRK